MSDKSVRFTPEQEEAIFYRGSDLLVSAAAGSGKTMVLVERLMSYICDEENPSDVDDFLIITYTKAAASELREKIIKALQSRIYASPTDQRLRRQLTKCYRAQIGTIHSFCVNILREYAYSLNLPTDFRVIDEKESKLIQNNVLNDLLESAYANPEDFPGFHLLIDTLSNGRDDSKLVEIILSLYETLQSHPYPEKWMDQYIHAFDLDADSGLESTIWGERILSEQQRSGSYWLLKIRELINSAPDTFLEKYGDTLAHTEDSLKTFVEACKTSWAAAAAATPIDFPRAPQIKGFETEKKIRNDCKNAMKKAVSVFKRDEPLLKEDLKSVQPVVNALFMLVSAFIKAYSEEKNRLGLVDFSDQEHLALKLLVDPETNLPTDTAAQVSKRFVEIMIDEYQDVNEVQDLILKSVTSKNGNRFMVGDIKQSIYRFRLAEPSIFMHKYLTYDHPEKGSETGHCVVLSKNFRSRREILDAVNFLFSNIMSEGAGEMEYTPREYLYYGAGDSYPTCDDKPIELDILDNEQISGKNQTEDCEEDSEEANTGESPKAIEYEAEFVARRIEQLVQDASVTDNGGLRKAKYGDIAILLRSASTKSSYYIKALQSHGIPVASDVTSKLFDTMEVSWIISLLSLLDNCHQDIPLTAVLMGPIFNYSMDDMADVRAIDRNVDLYTALTLFSENDVKAKNVIQTITDLRKMAAEISISGLIWHVYSAFDLLSTVSALPDGAYRKSNLMLFLEYAEKYESDGYKGLYSFINYVLELQKEGSGPDTLLPLDENAVKLMTVHKSKGLEFPIVILPDLAKKFNLQDAAKPVLLHKQLGIGLKRAIVDRKVTYDTISRKAIAMQSNFESKSEELRVLYVAMTRAKEKLIMVASFPSAQKVFDNLLKDASLPMNPVAVLNSANYAEWILSPALLRPEISGYLAGNPTESVPVGWNFYVITHLENISESLEKKTSLAAPAWLDPEFDTECPDDTLIQRLNYTYPNSAAARAPSKLTASQAKDFWNIDDEESLPLFSSPEPISFRAPDFAGDKSLSAAEVGTAFHKFFQFADPHAVSAQDGVDREIKRLIQNGVLSADESQHLDLQLLNRFFRSSIGEKLISDRFKVHRELRFSVLLPAALFYSGCTSDEILVQGVCDLCLENDDTIQIVDFKSDRVFGEEISDRARYYEPQLTVYAEALSRIFHKKVNACSLYFIRSGTQYDFDLSGT